MSKSTLPTKSQWGQFFKVLNKKEKIFFIFFALVAILSLSFLIRGAYINYTKAVAKEGGLYREGMVGSPRFINPVYSAPSDIDRALLELTYSGLMKYDGNGNIVADLAKEYKILEDGTIYEFSLKEDLLWSDSEPLTADDIIFTIKTFQNPAIKSPERAKWLGVKAEKISNTTVRFELKNSSAIFLENCTFKIMPQHIWEEIASQNFPVSIYNLRPIGSGPYKVKDLKQDNQGNITSLELTLNANYSGDRPYLQKIDFYFFETEKELIRAANSKNIDGFSLASKELYKDVDALKFNSYKLTLPRYFSVFLNQNPPNDNPDVLSDLKIREALNYGTDREKIINEAFSGYGKIVDSPILPDIFGLNSPEKTFTFDVEKAKILLDESGFSETDSGVREKKVREDAEFQFTKNLSVNSQGAEVTELQKCLAKFYDIYPDGTISGYFGGNTKTAVIKFQEKYREEILVPNNLSSGNGVVKASTREKLNEVCFPQKEETIPLSFTLTTVNQISLEKTAELLKAQWEELGVELEIQTFDIATIEQDVIKPRNYDMLLFGEILGILPDPFPFWHSSQVKDPGLNLAGYKNTDADKDLEAARENLNEDERKTALEDFQDTLLKETPVVFLYNPDYIYFVSKEVQGFKSTIIADPAKRFSDIANWYIKTRRVW